MAEEASAKDRTGWFQRTRWAEHLHAYPDWRLLSYAVRPPGDDEPELKRVELAEQGVGGLNTLSVETLRWLRSADTRPIGRMQEKSSQQRAASLWARLVHYCMRLVAADEGKEEGAEEQEQEIEMESESVSERAGRAWG